MSSLRLLCLRDRQQTPHLHAARRQQSAKDGEILPELAVKPSVTIEGMIHGLDSPPVLYSSLRAKSWTPQAKLTITPLTTMGFM